MLRLQNNRHVYYIIHNRQVYNACFVDVTVVNRRDSNVLFCRRDGCEL